jgi:hypothetical protein
VPVVAGGWYGGYGGGCNRWRVVATPWGPQWRLVNVCWAGYGPGWGGGWAGGPGFVGAAVW